MAARAKQTPNSDAPGPAAAVADWAADMERAVLDQAVSLAPRLGWSKAMATAAGRQAGLSAPETELLLPKGPADLAALLSRRHDAAALTRLSAIDPASLKMRRRIRAAVEARLDAALADQAAVKRCAGWLALPGQTALAMRLVWESADGLWHWAGDTATDENHYSKRLILGGILSAALGLALRHGREEAMVFVDRRIENVMAFETWKAKIKPGDGLAGFARGLSRLRYGART